MVKRKVFLTKVITQEFETTIEQETLTFDEAADAAWEKFNKEMPDAEVEYKTIVSKICN